MAPLKEFIAAVKSDQETFFWNDLPEKWLQRKQNMARWVSTMESWKVNHLQFLPWSYNFWPGVTIFDLKFQREIIFRRFISPCKLSWTRKSSKLGVHLAVLPKLIECTEPPSQGVATLLHATASSYSTCQTVFTVRQLKGWHRQLQRNSHEKMPDTSLVLTFTIRQAKGNVRKFWG